MSTPHSMENRQVLVEASSWFAEFRLGQPGNARRVEFMRWLRRSPEHIRAYLEISDAYARLPTAATVHPAQIERLIERVRARSNVLPLDGAAETAWSIAQTNQEHSRAKRPWASRIAASLVVACVGAVIAAGIFVRRFPVYATQIAEHRSIALDDGSRMELNARTRVKIAFSATERRVDILEGQALFQVAKDAARPFIVHGAGARIRAIGTRFDVNLKKSGTIVTVLEGTVAVFDLATAARIGPIVDDLAAGAPLAGTVPVLLVAGEQARITDEVLAKSNSANIAAATAWTDGQLEFDEATLADVVEELNRYSRARLVIESKSLEQFLITGIYSSSDPRSLIRFLQNQPDLAVTETGGEIHIRKK